MRIALGSDHAGYELKEYLKAFLPSIGVEYEDMGTDTSEAVDYPDYGVKVARGVNCGEYERGLLICGTGIGMSIVANRFANVRAALCHNVFMAQSSREHNNANILILGARVISPEDAETIVKTWFATGFAGGRHSRRVEKIKALGGQTECNCGE